MAKQNKPLAGYVRNKKVLLSPFNHKFPIETYVYGDNILSLIWMALIIDNNGLSLQTSSLIVKIARIGFNLINDGKKSFLFGHNFNGLSVEQKNKMLSKLTEEEKDILNGAFSVFAFFYPEFPLCFLITKKHDVKPDDIRFIEELFKLISDKRSKLSVSTIACAVASMGEQGKIHFAPHLVPNLNSLADYPNSDESLKTASSLRAMFGMFFMGEEKEQASEWVNYVWKTGEQYPCVPNASWAEYMKFIGEEDVNY